MLDKDFGVFKNPSEQYKRYVDEALKEAYELSIPQREKEMKEFWGTPELLRYLEELPIDEPTKYLTSSISEILPNVKEKKILSVGGGTGKLGRYIASTYRDSSVLEIDTSIKMVGEANRLAKMNGQNNFISIEADAINLPFKDGEHDYVVAYGLFRHILNEKDWPIIIREMLRVSKYGITIAEGDEKDVVYSLRDLVDPTLMVKETQMPMFRMTLFYIILRKYKTDQQFRELIDKNSDNKPIQLLSKLAGISEKTLYELRLNPSHYFF
jgi:ubiquinone/menaquinone biosynthesis C-methylase UbiE